MKSFFALALLGALAVADDAADKLAVSGLDNHGTKIGALENAIPSTDVTLKTGTAGNKGTLKLATGWRKTSGSDGQTYLGFMWDVVPSSLYTIAAKLDIAFAKDKSTGLINYTRFSRKVLGGNTYIYYNYATLNRSLTNFSTGGAALTSAESARLTSGQQLWTVKDDKLTGTNAALDGKIWDIDFNNSVYTSASGAQTIYLERTNAGNEEIKVGGAAFVWWQFTDANGSQNAGNYMKWADAEHDDDGTSSITAFAAIAAAAVVALF